MCKLRSAFLFWFTEIFSAVPANNNCTELVMFMGREDDIQEIRKEVQMLAGCKCRNITQYYGAIMQPGTTELQIVLELMSCSVADLVRPCGGCYLLSLMQRPYMPVYQQTPHDCPPAVRPHQPHGTALHA